MDGESGLPKGRVQKRAIRRLRILGYSSLALAVVVAVLMLTTGNIGFGIFILVGTVLFGLSLWRIERSLASDVDRV